MPQTLDIKLNDRQALAFRYLMDNSTRVIFYGGGAGSGKSWLAAVWLWLMMRSYRNLRYGVFRKQVLDVASTFTATFFKVVSHMGDKCSHYKATLNGIVNLKTGSEIVYRSLMYLPSDPDYQRLGSYEYTGAVIEEAMDGIQKEAFETVRTRIGRQRNKELGILPKVMITANPGPGWLYTDFVKLRDDPVFNWDKKVVLATSKDNLEFLPEEYIQQLQDISDPIIKKRLLEGSWTTSDMRADIVCPYSWIVGCLEVGPEDGDTYLGIDVAGCEAWSDKTIIQPLVGNVIETPIVIPSKEYSGPRWGYDDWLVQRIEEVIESYGIKDFKKVRIDASGIGDPIYKRLRMDGYTIFGFRGDAKPFQRKFQKTQFINLRTQAYKELAELFRLQKLKLKTDYSRQLVEELSSIRYSTTTTKTALELKKFTKQRLGHSPDYSDALAMAALKLGVPEQSKSSTATAIELTSEGGASVL